MSEPTRTPNLRKMRHSAQKRLITAVYGLGGQPGLNKADQMIRLDAVIELLEEALTKVKKARQFVAERDFDAHLAAKQAAKAQAQAAQEAAESLPDGPEKADEAKTFEQLINQLADMGTDKPEATPPF